SSRRRHTRSKRDWSSDVCSSDLDFELCYQGETSEDVQRGLNDGSFGMADETGRMMNAALAEGVARGLGAGRALGERALAFPNKRSEERRVGKECRYRGCGEH